MHSWKWSCDCSFAIENCNTIIVVCTFDLQTYVWNMPLLILIQIDHHSQFFSSLTKVFFFLSSHHAWSSCTYISYIYPKCSLKMCLCSSHGKARGWQSTGWQFKPNPSYFWSNRGSSCYFWREPVDQSAIGDGQTHKLANDVAYTKNLLQGSCVFWIVPIRNPTGGEGVAQQPPVSRGV